MADLFTCASKWMHTSHGRPLRALCATLAAVTLVGCSSHGVASSTGASPKSSSSSAVSGPSLAKPVAHRTIPASTPGNIDQTVASVAQHTLVAVPLSGAAVLGSGIVATIKSVNAITATTSLPGQVGGPSVEVLVQISNGGNQPIVVQNVNVNLIDSAGDPAGQITTAPARAFSGTIAAGGKATGIYVFSISTTRRNPITVEFNYAAGTPVARFIGGVK